MGQPDRETRLAVNEMRLDSPDGGEARLDAVESS
jgi:hypothetical protein